ncbi:MAG: chalcone isomerase family protein, partial [Rhizobacter sp.]
MRPAPPEIALIRRLLTLATLLLATAAAHAQTTDVGGVKYENNLRSGTTPLVLNGAGIRYKAIFKVYSA